MKCTSRGFHFIEDAIESNIEHAAILKLRNQLMDEIIYTIRERAWTLSQTAKSCGITEARLNELLSNKISKFSLEDLVAIAAKSGISIRLKRIT